MHNTVAGDVSHLTSSGSIGSMSSPRTLLPLYVIGDYPCIVVCTVRESKTSTVVSHLSSRVSIATTDSSIVSSASY